MAKRRRRSKSAAVAAATVAEIKARKRAFLREVSSLLSDALGFPVRVSMVPRTVDLSPDERRASRRSARDNRARVRASAEQLYAPVAEAFFADGGPPWGSLPDDDIPEGG